jgi:hypothetical protein
MGSNDFTDADLDKLRKDGFIVLFENVEFIPYQGFRVIYTTTKGE